MFSNYALSVHSGSVDHHAAFLSSKDNCCGLFVFFFLLVPAISISKTAILLSVHLAMVAC
jgi:hypothetical protein